MEQLGSVPSSFSPNFPILQWKSKHISSTLHQQATPGHAVVCEMLVLLGCQKLPAITYGMYYPGGSGAASCCFICYSMKAKLRSLTGHPRRKSELEAQHPHLEELRGMKRGSRAPSQGPAFNEMFTAAQP